MTELGFDIGSIFNDIFIVVVDRAMLSFLNHIFNHFFFSGLAKTEEEQILTTESSTKGRLTIRLVNGK